MASYTVSYPTDGWEATITSDLSVEEIIKLGRLFAAAPDLLTTSEAALNFILYEYSKGRISKFNADVVIELLRAAIGKATSSIDAL